MPIPPSGDDATVEELVARYYELRGTPHEVSLEQLCADYPHLSERVEKRATRLLRAEQLAVGTATHPQPCRAPGGVPRRFEGLEHYRDGGMGRVYLAWDVETARRVAYKVLRPELDHPPHRKRFIEEAQLTAGLRHAGVVPVFGVVTDACGLPAYAMEFIDGATLDEVVRLAAWPKADRPRAKLRDLLDHFLTICGAVAFAHSRKILHNDLKSNNIRLSKAGEPFVIDWGLATAQKSALTPDDAAKDIVRLGGILHEILTGARAVRVTDPDGKLLPWAFEPGSQLNAPPVPKALAAVCRRAISVDNAVRYPTVAALAADVQAWVEGLAVTAYRNWWHVRAIRWAARHPGLTTGLAAAVLLGLGVVVAVGELKAARIREEARQKEAADNRRWMNHNHGMVHFLGVHYYQQANTVDRATRDKLAESSARGIEYFEAASREAPDERSHRYFLGLATLQLASLKAAKATPTDWEHALALYDRGEELLAPIDDERNRTDLPVISNIAPPGAVLPYLRDDIRLGRALVLLQLGRCSEALIQADLAGPSVASAVLRSGALPGAEHEQQSLPWSRGPGADHAKAMRLAGYLAEARGVSGPAVYNVACVFSLASAEAGIDPAERQRRGDEAVKYLRRLHDAKYFDNAEKGEKRRRDFWNDVENADLTPLRDRADFRQLCQAVRTKWP